MGSLLFLLLLSPGGGGGAATIAADRPLPPLALSSLSRALLRSRRGKKEGVCMSKGVRGAHGWVVSGAR